MMGISPGVEQVDSNNTLTQQGHLWYYRAGAAQLNSLLCAHIMCFDPADVVLTRSNFEHYT